MSNVTIGSYLKDLRLRKGYSLERLSSETKISLSILKKLEQNELSKLPNITYVKGYVQNCLKSLHTSYGQDIISIIDQTYRELGLMESKEIIRSNIEENEKKSEHDNNSTQQNHKIYNVESILSKNTLLGISLILVVITIFTFVKKIQVQNTQRHSVAIDLSDSTQPVQQNTIEKYVKIPDQKMPVINSTSTSTEIAATATPKIANTVESTPLATPAVVNVTFPKFEFKKISNLGITFQDENDNEKDLDSYTEEDRKRVTANKQNLFIKKTDGESWISYKKDNDPPRSTLLKKGQKFFITGDKLFITIGNTENLKIFFNGKIVSFTGSRGVKSFIFPVNEASNHSLPLFVRDSTDKLYFYEDYIPLMNQESSASSSEVPKQQ